MNNVALAAAIGASAIVAACSTAPDYSGLSDDGVYGPTPASSSASASRGTSAPTAGPQPPSFPIPSTGPGSAASTARQFFIDHVYPSLDKTCASCHSTGLDGAPVFLQKVAATAYQTIDVRGMIQPNSLLATKGLHVGPALTAPQRTLVATWLAKEASERVGQAAPVNILERIGDCLDETLFNAIGFDNLRTQPGQNEDADKCTGCNKAQCNVCHTAGDGNFYMAIGSGLDDTTFAKTKQAAFVIRYIGLNGTTPVPSSAIKLKSDSTVLDPMHYHPMFKLDAAMLKSIDDFAKAAIYKYLAGQCGK